MIPKAPHKTNAARPAETSTGVKSYVGWFLQARFESEDNEDEGVLENMGPKTVLRTRAAAAAKTEGLCNCR